MQILNLVNLTLASLDLRETNSLKQDWFQGLHMVVNLCSKKCIMPYRTTKKYLKYKRYLFGHMPVFIKHSELNQHILKVHFRWSLFT
jgi:hypothetical protein